MPVSRDDVGKIPITAAGKLNRADKNEIRERELVNENRKMVVVRI